MAMGQQKGAQKNEVPYNQIIFSFCLFSHQSRRFSVVFYGGFLWFSMVLYRFLSISTMPRLFAAPAARHSPLLRDLWPCLRGAPRGPWAEAAGVWRGCAAGKCSGHLWNNMASWEGYFCVCFWFGVGCSRVLWVPYAKLKVLCAVCCATSFFAAVVLKVPWSSEDCNLTFL